jgi:CheY-like chemotaxis protein
MKLVYPDKKRILFADDDIALGGITKLSLEHSGYEVRAVHSGSEALRAFSTSPLSFDLVILDQDMPDLKGTEVAEKLAGLFPGIPIVLYTGCQEDELALIARTAGVKAVASKSLTTEELLDVIDRTIDNRQKEEAEFPYRTNSRLPGGLGGTEQRQPSESRVNHNSCSPAPGSGSLLGGRPLAMLACATKSICPDID